jgi:mandelate racemase
MRIRAQVWQADPIMIKITGLEASTVLVPMAEPHRTASGVVAASPLVLIRVHTDAGIQGQSLLFTYTPAALQATAHMVRGMEPLIINQPLAPASVWQALHARFRLLGTQGLVGMAIAGIDMALWDALAHSQKLPLFGLLGHEPDAAKPLKPYGAVGYDGVNGSAAVAEAWAKRGLHGVKAKIGYASLGEDLAVIRAMRQAVGPDVAIMVDYNQSLRPSEAAQRLHALDEEGLTWIEEPVLAHDFAALAELARSTRTPLQAGENWWGPLDFRHALDAGARDLLMPDVMKCGGVTGWQQVASLAAVHGVPVSNHLWPEISAQLLYATPTASWLEYADWWNPILQAPLRIEKGFVVMQDQAGSGVRFDEDAVRRFTV